MRPIMALMLVAGGALLPGCDDGEAPATVDAADAEVALDAGPDAPDAAVDAGPDAEPDAAPPLRAPPPDWWLSTVRGRIHALDRADGREVWSTVVGESVASGVTVTGGWLYVGHGFSMFKAPRQVVGGFRAYALPDP